VWGAESCLHAEPFGDDSDRAVNGRAAWACGLAVLGCVVQGCAPAAPPRPSLPPLPAEPVVSAPAPAEWPRREVLELALAAYECGAHEGRFQRPVLSIVDYSLPSSQPRLWVIDLTAMRVLHHELVAHGERSGDTFAVAFSNEISSHQSSLGLFRADEAYRGTYGYSLRLSGLEPGINDNARARAIVVHGAPYVSQAVVAQSGTIGTTFGCLGLPEDVSARVIDEISGGSALFAYYPDTEWLRGSHFLHCARGPAVGISAAAGTREHSPS